MRPYFIAVGCKHLHPIFLSARPACTAPDVAVFIDSKTIGYRVAQVTEHPMACQRIGIRHVKGVYLTGVTGLVGDPVSLTYRIL